MSIQMSILSKNQGTYNIIIANVVQDLYFVLNTIVCRAPPHS